MKPLPHRIKVINPVITEGLRDLSELRAHEHAGLSIAHTLLGAEACRAVLDDGADVIVLGCTGFLGCADVVAAPLRLAGLGGVHVIDPIPVTVHLAQAMCMSGLRHSKRAWQAPARKPIGGYAALQLAMG